jgi:hypothetical protein
MSMPYDPENPPPEPPRGADPLVWRLAYQVHSDHRLGPDGRCTAEACVGVGWPCGAARLSAAGFAVAAGSRAPWPTLNRGTARYRTNAPRREFERENVERHKRHVIVDTGMCRIETDPEHGVIIRGGVTTAIVDGESVLVPHR